MEPRPEILVAVREPDADLVEVCLDDDPRWVMADRLFQEACRVPGFEGRGERIPEELKHQGERCRIVELFVQYGADPSMMDGRRRSPLLMACRYDMPQVMETLLTLGADPDTRDLRKSTVLTRAADLGHLACASVLLAAGADINVQNSRGFTPLHRAVMHGHKRVVVLLLAHGADPAITDEIGYRAVDYVKSEPMREIICSRE